MSRRPLVLITGGAGFIGSHTADALAARGYRVRILDNLAPPVHDGRWPDYVRGKGYELLRGDVRKRSDWLRGLKGVSYVFHLAAYQDQRPDFSTFFETNTVGTALLYELIVAKRLPVRKVILASSQFVYGDGQYRCMHNGEHESNRSYRSHTNYRNFYPELRTLAQFKNEKFDIFCPHGKPAQFVPFREDQPLTPTNSYGLSKRALEELALRLGKTYGIPTTVLRYSIVQGPRQSPRNVYSGALRIFVRQALRGKPITVFEDGRQRRDFVNIGDVVAANLLVLKKPAADFHIFNVGGGRAHTVLSFARLVKRVTGSRSKIEVGGFRRTDTRHAVSDIMKLRRLGWRPRFSPERSVRDYVAWYRSAGY
jgi:dTDP-L-rhamnose 4-epimerase